MWRTIGVSVALPTKPVCEDAHLWRRLDDGTLLMIIADGAGAAHRAQIGAEIASHTALDYLISNIKSVAVANRASEWRSLVAAAMEAAIAALRTEAAIQGVPLDYYATTLTAAIVIPDLVVVAQVGDGMVFVADTTGAIIALTMPQRGEYSNETCMLTSSYALEMMQIVVWDQPITAIAAMTDGLLPITTILPLYAPYSPFFTNLFAFLQTTADTDTAASKLKSLLLSEKIQNGTGDDLTLVLAVQVE